MEYWLWKKPWLVLTGVIVLVQLFVSSSGCFPEEKASLLDFKAAYSNESLLPSWMDDPKSNCCDWERITCDSSSGHVIHLSLETLNRNRSGFARLNWSLFLSFRELRSLHLSNGRFDEFIWKGDNRSKSALKRLETLDLSHNYFNESIMEPLSSLTTLKNLNLAYNEIGGLFPSQEMSLLRNLESLDLQFNLLTGPLTAQGSYYMSVIEGLEVITKGLSLLYKGIILEDMSAFDLSSNQLTGKIPYQMGYLQGLRALNLSNNLLNGSIPESFYKLESIESLDLSNNNLSGQIPLQLQDLHSLSVFNVSYNNLSGRAPDKGQFGTFDESSYKGNPYLAYEISNRGIATTPSPPPTPLDESEKDDSAIDLTSFYWSFVASYVTVVIVLVTILWINPYWRGAWFYIVQRCLLKCFGQCLKDAFS